MGCIRRIVLDAFWSRSSSTVTTNAAMMRATMLTTTSMLGHSEGPYGDPGPLPAYDHCGYLVAMQMVASSRGKGRYSPTHKQWDTIRKIKTLFSSHYRATAKANTGAVTMMSTKGVGPQVLTQDPCCSLWFQRFSEGCRKRMGQEWRPDKTISVCLVGELLAMVEQRVMDATETKDKVKWLLAGGYFCICYVVSLRSTEGLLCDVEGLLDHFNERSDHVVIALRGQVKGEHHSRQHLMPCVHVTDSGIRVKVWINRILAVHAMDGRTTGPAFINGDGIQSSTAEMNDVFHELMVELFHYRRELFDIEIKSESDISDKYNVYRSFRRGSESRAMSRKVIEADRYIVHRWRKKEAAGQNKVGHAIDQLYVDISLVKESFLRYTQAM